VLKISEKESFNAFLPLENAAVGYFDRLGIIREKVGAFLVLAIIQVITLDFFQPVYLHCIFNDLEPFFYFL
jgi:hypothetical protein